MRGVQAARPSLYGLATELAGIRVPVIIMTGDEDEGCLEPALMLKRHPRVRPERAAPDRPYR
jgi:hypothetical protein